MTINQIIAKQDKKEMYAVGKYQMIPIVLKEGKKILKLTGDEKFDAAMQERLFKDYLISNKPGREDLRDYISGKSNNLEAALNDLSREFSSVSKVYGRLESNYPGDKASISREEAAAALIAERERYKQNKQASLQSKDGDISLNDGKQADEKSKTEAKPPVVGQQLSDVSKENGQKRITQAKNMVNILGGGQQKQKAEQRAPHLIPAINLSNNMVA